MDAHIMEHWALLTQRNKMDSIWTVSSVCFAFTFSFCFHFRRHQTAKQLHNTLAVPLLVVATQQHVCARSVVSILFKFVEQMFKRNKEWPRQIYNPRNIPMLVRLLARTLWLQFTLHVPEIFHSHLICARMLCVSCMFVCRYVRLVSHQIRL